MSHQDLTQVPVHQLSQLLQSRKLSPVEVTEAYLTKIERQDSKLHAFVQVYADDARLAARGAEAAIQAGHSVGPLHGVPIALKDLIELITWILVESSKLNVRNKKKSIENLDFF